MLTFLVGLALAFLLHFIPYQWPDRGSEPDTRPLLEIDYDSLLAAAGVLATIAVATALTDLPIKADSNHHRDQSLKSHEVPIFEQYTERQLILSSLLLTITSFVAMTCVGLALLQPLSRSMFCDDCEPRSSSIAIVLITITAHFATALVGSMGLRYKHHAFLRSRNHQRIQRQYRMDAWSATWGLTRDQAMQRPRHTGRVTFRVFSKITVVLIGISAVIISPVAVFAPLPTVAGEFVFLMFYCVLVTGSLYFSVESLFAHEIARRAAVVGNEPRTGGAKVHLVLGLLMTVLLAVVQLSYTLLYTVATRRGTEGELSSFAQHWSSDLQPWLFLCLTLVYLAIVYYLWRCFLPRFKFNTSYRGLKRAPQTLIAGLLFATVVNDRHRNIGQLPQTKPRKHHSRHQQAIELVRGTPHDAQDSRDN